MQVSKITESDIVFIRDNPDSYESYLFNKNCQAFASGIVNQRFPNAFAFNRSEIAADCVWQAYRSLGKFLAYKSPTKTFVKWYRSICHRRISAYVRDNFGGVWGDTFCFNETYYLDKSSGSMSDEGSKSGTFESLSSIKGSMGEVELREIINLAATRTLEKVDRDYAEISLKMYLSGWKCAEIARKLGFSRKPINRILLVFEEEFAKLTEESN